MLPAPVEAQPVPSPVLMPAAAAPASDDFGDALSALYSAADARGFTCRVIIDRGAS
jgi:hypothetical protein